MLRLIIGRNAANTYRISICVNFMWLFWPVSSASKYGKNRANLPIPSRRVSKKRPKTPLPAINRLQGHGEGNRENI